MIPPEVSKLLEGGVDLEKESGAVSKTLESIGLSSYEARGYVALVAHGYGSAETIAETAKIPRTSAYKVLQSLCSKGFAISTRGRPTIFKPESPAKIKEKVIERLSESFDKLDLIHEILREKGEPQLVYTITGKARLLDKVGELLDRATESFIVATPSFYEIRERLSKKLENAIDRGVRVTIITEPMQKVPEGSTVYWRKGLIATDIIADGERALLASPDLSACGFTDNAALAAHLESFLRILMAQKE
ncbi:MAG TPA: helix-turn-helix domain-containing protein [Thermoplasmata archaeon]|nr:helix-turn-helix domain-containing protein [Thermoplasmata archaeon]HLA47051.1 helix-turn-helix domain-containing protein [Thermoplasmata archaeon]